MLMTLFDACVMYIAKHIYLVESFDGFPDLIGEKIFKAVKALGKFGIQDGSSLQALSLFTSAYNASVLHSVCLEGEHLALADCIQHLQLFTHLHVLNVSSCGLGDDHELLHHISKLPRLQILALCDNALTDSGIRKMTAPIRVMKTGPLQLKCLDLSENTGISPSSLKYLRVFRQLLFLDLSATAVRRAQSETNEFAAKMALEPRTASLKLSDLLDLGTRGWACGVVESWVMETQQKCQRQLNKSAQRMQDPTQRFYGRKTKATHAADGSSSAVQLSKQLRRDLQTLVLVSGDFDEQLPSLKEQILDPTGAPDRSPQEECKVAIRPQSAVVPSQKSRIDCRACTPSSIHDQHIVTEPPAKVRRTDRKCGTPPKEGTLQKGGAVAETVNICDKDEAMSDEDALLLRQYGYLGT